MQKTKSIAAIAGPTLIVMIAAEMKFWNPTLYDTQIAPVVYLNGVLLFVAGLAIVRNHNIWTYGWPTVLTLSGYTTLVVGLFRMFFPQVQQEKFENNLPVFMAEVIMIFIGIFLTFKAYYPTK